MVCKIAFEENRLHRSVGGIGSLGQLACDMIAERRIIDRYTGEKDKGRDVINRYIHCAAIG